MPRTPATPDPAPTSRGRRASRVLGTIVAAGAMFASTALIAPAAWAECTVQNRYTAVEGGYWVAFEALFVPPGNGKVVQEITASRTYSTTTEVSSELGMSVGSFIAEVNVELRASFQETATVSRGTTTTVTAPKSRRSQEIRFGTYKQKIKVERIPFGCPNSLETRTTYEYAARTSAGAVFV